jgi:O-methyltransferase
MEKDMSEIREATDVLNESEARYLDLLKRCLTRAAMPEKYQAIAGDHGVIKRLVSRSIRHLLAIRGLELVHAVRPSRPDIREEGRDWPSDAETMIGLRRLDNLQECILSVIAEGIPGDLIETGVWRGGACIFMRAVLQVRGVTDRTVWAADSFCGLPKPDSAKYPADRGDGHWRHTRLAVPLEEVKGNFAKYGLLDSQVQFLAGWFCDTLPTAPIKRLAILRMDGDMYQSTIEALGSLYPKVSPGGYVIVDDYALPGCRSAIDQYREQHRINEPLIPVDWTGVYWRKV